MLAILINENNTYEIIKTEKSPNLEELQKYVEGYIELVHINNNTIFYINEEGKFTKEMNKLATAFWTTHIYKRTGRSDINDFISGNALYIGLDGEGETESLTDKQIFEFVQFEKTFNELFGI